MLATLVARVNDEVAAVSRTTGGQFMPIFGPVVLLAVGAFMFIHNGLLPGSILIGSATLSFAVITHKSIASRRARREVLPELSPQDADRLFHEVTLARNALLTAGASLTGAERREHLLRDVEMRLGLRAKERE